MSHELKKIIKLWYENIYNKVIKKKNNLFSGCCGHQLEILFGLKPNNKNISDFTNYELKTYSSKITFGDWKGKFLFEFDPKMSRLDFLKRFGRLNLKKNKYYLVKPAVPTFPCVSLKGYFWEITKKELQLNGKDSTGKYSLCIWNLKELKKKYINKFSGKILLTKKNKEGVHKSLLIVNKLKWELFLKFFIKGVIYLDPCLSTGCNRNRCLFRISTKELLAICGYTEYFVCPSSNKIIKKIISKKY